MRASRHTLSILVMVVIFLNLTASLEARQVTSQARIFAAYLAPDLDPEGVNEQGNLISLESSDELGFGLGLGLRLTPRLGLDLSLRIADPQLSLDVIQQQGIDFSSRDRFSLIPLTIAPTFHLLGERSVDLYIAPMLVYTFIGDINFEANIDGVSESSNLRTDDDLSWGLALGLDLQLADSPWALSAVIEHLDTQLDVLDLDDGVRTVLDLDPLVIRFGFGYRF